MKMTLLAALAAALPLTLPAQARACACGCDVFDVGGETMMPMRKGAEVFVEADYQDQNRNWSGNTKAAAADNADKDIRTRFFTASAQYTFNQSWTLAVQVSVWSRRFSTEKSAGAAIDSFDHAALGDIRLMAIYTGLSRDMSTGLIGGVKLPTGDWKYPNFDRDTEIGSGGANILIGAYHMGFLSRDGAWGYFIHALLDLPVTSQGGYRPGSDINGAVGLTYRAGAFANGRVQVTPLLQLLGSGRQRDAGPAANSADSGYSRVLLSPGVQFTAGAWSLYGDVEVPIYQHVNGDQLAAPQLVKVVVSRRF